MPGRPNARPKIEAALADASNSNAAEPQIAIMVAQEPTALNVSAARNAAMRGSRGDDMAPLDLIAPTMTTRFQVVNAKEPPRRAAPLESVDRRISRR